MAGTPACNASIGIIGAGIVGVASALVLAQRGHNVSVYDPCPPGQAGASRGNAGHVAAADIFPMTRPGILRTGLTMMVRPDAPLRLPGVEKLRLAPWLMRFLAAARNQRFAASTKALLHLNREAIEETEKLLGQAGISDMMRANGVAVLHDNVRSLAAGAALWSARERAGFPSQELDHAAIARLVPGISPQFTHGRFCAHWAQVADPFALVQGLAHAAANRGVRFHRKKVLGLAADADTVRITHEGGTTIYDRAVIAAGVWSRPLAACLGETLPLVAERGYNLTFPDPGFVLDVPLVLPDRGLAITHVCEGLRIGGWAEFSRSPDRPENGRIFAALKRISLDIFPGLAPHDARAWMGSRPALPDSVPVISRSSTSERIFYNCGHGHYGLTQATTSAQFLAQLIEGKNPGEELRAAFSITRLQR